jgi:hypothetical protein
MGAATENTGRGPSRAIRGALLFLLLGGAVGAAIGWTTGSVCYRAQALVYIAPPEPLAANPQSTEHPRFEGYLRYQVDILKSPRLALLAMRTEAWQKTGGSHQPEDVAAFLEQRSIAHKQGTQHIQVGFLHGQPEIALAGVLALLTAYEQLAPELGGSSEKAERARQQIDLLAGKSKEAMEQILKLTTEHGGLEGLQLLHQEAVKRVLEAEDALAQVRQLIEEGGVKGDTLEELKAREKRLVARLDRLREVGRMLGETRAEVERLMKSKADDERQLERMRALREELEKKLLGEGPIRIWDRGSLPTEPFEDNRAAHALRGFGFGALPGLLLLLLFTLSGRRASSKAS